MSSPLLSRIFHSYLPYVALFLAHAIWGANFIVAKVTLQEFPPSSLAFLRFLLATLLLTPFFLAQSKKVSIKKEDLPSLVGIGISIVTLNIAFFFAGISRTSAINASVLTLIIPMLSVLLGWLFLKETVYFINILGLIIALIGSIIIIGIPQIFLGTVTSQAIFGNILIILASVSFVIGAIISRKMLKKYPSLIVTGIAFLVGTITFLPPAFVELQQNPNWFMHISVLGAFGLIYMTLLSSISAYFLYEWGLAKTSVSRADFFQYVEPLIAASLAIPLLGEKINVTFVSGAILIIAGVFLGTQAKEFYHRIHKYHRH